MDNAPPHMIEVFCTNCDESGQVITKIPTDPSPSVETQACPICRGEKILRVPVEYLVGTAKDFTYDLNRKIVEHLGFTQSNLSQEDGGWNYDMWFHSDIDIWVGDVPLSMEGRLMVSLRHKTPAFVQRLLQNFYSWMTERAQITFPPARLTEPIR